MLSPLPKSGDFRANIAESARMNGYCYLPQQQSPSWVNQREDAYLEQKRAYARTRRGGGRRARGSGLLKQLAVRQRQHSRQHVR
jgi:hypothetical protein